MFQTREGSQVPCATRMAPMTASLTFALPQLITFQQGPRSFGTLASISASTSGLFGASQKDAATGIAFPSSYCVLKQKNCPELAGVGVRAKRLLGIKNINVYSLGLYVDPHGAKKLLQKYKGKSPEELVKTQGVYDALIQDGSFEKTLRLVISFGALKRSQFVSALEERLAPPLKKAGEPGATLESFQRLFDGAVFRKGMEVSFTTNSGASLTTQIDGKVVGTIKSPQLVKALFGIYLGSDPVSADAKNSFGSGLAALLAGA